MRLEQLTLAQLAGQRLMVGFEGTELTTELKRHIDTHLVGGVILFAINLESPDQIRRLCADMQSYAKECGQPPLLIAVDQEGGEVARLRHPFTEFPGNPRIRFTAEAAEFARITAREMAAVGFNMDMAPVVDVADPEIDSIMSGRVFGTDAHQVAELGSAVIRHLQRGGIAAVAKHFPGIGRTVVDSHLELPHCDVDEADLAASDLIPFQAAIDCGVAAVMLSHILYPRLDPRWPASLSIAIARDLLRGRMGYQGVVITDDLDMKAIADHYDVATAVGRILAAEIDIVLICHKGPGIQTACDVIRTAVSTDERLYQTCRESVARILTLKRKFLPKA
jgi:beta-N-acetylhexosaminidase